MIEEIGNKPQSDYRNMLKTRWGKVREHAEILQAETGKQTTGYFFKKTMVAGLLLSCVFFGFKLWVFKWKLPITGIQFSGSGLPVQAAQLEDSRCRVLRSWPGMAASNVRLPGIPPDTYSLMVDFVDSFPVQINPKVNLGEMPDLSDDIANAYGKSQGVLEFTVPAGSQIVMEQQSTGAVRKYGVVAETLPTGISSCTGLDWGPVSGILSVSELGGKIQVISTSGDNKVLGTMFVQGQTFQSTRLGTLNGKTMVTGIALGGDIYVWEAGSGKLVGNSTMGAEVVALEFKRDGNSLLTLDSDYNLREWELDSGNQEFLVNLAPQGKGEFDWSLAQPHPAWKLVMPAGLKISLGKKPKLAQILPHSQDIPLTIGVMDVNGRLTIWSGDTPDRLNLAYQSEEELELETFALHPSGKWLVMAQPKEGLVKAWFPRETKRNYGPCRQKMVTTQLPGSFLPPPATPWQRLIQKGTFTGSPCMANPRERNSNPKLLHRSPRLVPLWWIKSPCFPKAAKSKYGKEL